MRRIFCSLLIVFSLMLPTVAQADIWDLIRNDAYVGMDPTVGEINVPVDQTIVVYFWEKMDFSTIGDGTFYLEKASGGGKIAATITEQHYVSSVLHREVSRIWLNPDSQLAYDTVYKVTLGRSIELFNSNVDLGDYNGNKSFTWTFRTLPNLPPGDTTPPQVSWVNPANNATNVPVGSSVVVKFNEMMDASTITTTNLILKAGATVISASVSYDTATQEATINPDVNLTGFTDYTVTVTSGVKDISGNALQVNFTSTFKTVYVDTTPPTILSVDPLADQTGVATSTLVSVTFSENVQESTVLSSFSVTTGGVAVPGAITYDPTSFVARFTPTNPLTAGATYTATVTTGIRDLAGNALATSKTWNFVTLAPVVAATTNAYCHSPSFLATVGSKPNVLLIIDNSGSMNDFAYPASYNPNDSYYGYFSANKMYKYNTTSGGYFEVDTTKAMDRESFWCGNFLNWVSMRRVDLVRKVLVGGKTQPRSANTANYLLAEDTTDGDHYRSYNNKDYYIDEAKIRAGNDSPYTYYDIKVYVGDQPPQDGLIIGDMGNQLNFGIMFFNDGYRFEDNRNSSRDGGYVAVDLGSTSTNILTQVENTAATTWTPLGEALYEATHYFQAVTGPYNNANYSAKDPITSKCQKQFVIVLTDGESTKDRNIPGGNWNSPGTLVTSSIFNVRTWMDKIATNEGFTSKWDATPNSSESSYYMEGVSYWSHVTDLRSATVGNSDLAGKQNLTTYVVYAFDNSTTGRDMLRRVAKYGGFEDSNNNDKPDIQKEWDRNGDNIPDTYFEAQQGNELESKIKAALYDILARVSSGTAASILSNSDNNGSNLLQAVFYPRKIFGDTEVSWTGELQALWYYIDPYLRSNSIREDTVVDKVLKLKDDDVAEFFMDTTVNQTRVKLYDDANGDTVKDTVSPRNIDIPDNINSLWRGGKALWKRNLSTSPRSIKTIINGALENFSIANSANLLTNLQAANTTEANAIINYVHGYEQPGFRPRTVTIGSEGTYVWKLGDIISSTPKLQSSAKQNNYDDAAPNGYADSDYKKYALSSNYLKRGMAYVGANDGMLHAFKLGKLDRGTSAAEVSVITDPDNDPVTDYSNLGKEMWSFIPKNALPYLRYLTDPNYCHLYYVDLTPYLADVSFGFTDTDTDPLYSCTDAQYWKCKKQTTLNTDNSLDLSAGKTSWRSIVIGGMGMGGASKASTYAGSSGVKTPIAGLGYSSYFALDVTDPSNPSYLWEFPDPSRANHAAAVGSLGFSTSGPALIRLGQSKDKNGRWFVVFASGPTGPINVTYRQFMGESDQSLKIFILDLKTGELLRTIDTGIANAFAGAMTGATIDTDRSHTTLAGNFSDDAIYVGYTYKPTSGTTWNKGGVLRILTQDASDTNAETDAYNPANWTWSKVIEEIGPVTAGIAKLQDRATQKLWLYFGTGRYFYRTTAVDSETDRQSLYGIMEPCYGVSGTNDISQGCSTTITRSQLLDQSASTASTTASDIIAAGNKGWYIDLAAAGGTFAAQRVITDTVASSNGAVFFSSFKPNSDICGYGGSSSLWAVQYNSGLGLKQAQKTGQVLIQVSTGAFEQKDISSSFTQSGGRESATFEGVSPKSAPAVITNAGLNPVRKIMHIKEK